MTATILMHPVLTIVDINCHVLHCHTLFNQSSRLCHR